MGQESITFYVFKGNPISVLTTLTEPAANINSCYSAISPVLSNLRIIAGGIYPASSIADQNYVGKFYNLQLRVGSFPMSSYTGGADKGSLS